MLLCRGPMLRSNVVMLRYNAVMPRSNAVMLRSNAVMPRSNVVLLRSNAVMMRYNAVMPKSNAVMPRSNVVMLRSNAVMPRFNAVMLRSNVVMLRYNIVMPCVPLYSTTSRMSTLLCWRLRQHRWFSMLHCCSYCRHTFGNYLWWPRTVIGVVGRDAQNHATRCPDQCYNVTVVPSFRRCIALSLHRITPSRHCSIALPHSQQR